MMKLKTKQGRLTSYALACGYIEIKQTEDGLRTTLWKEHGTFHVRHVQRGNRGEQKIYWQAFGKLKEARKLFDQQPGKLTK